MSLVLLNVLLHKFPSIAVIIVSILIRLNLSKLIRQREILVRLGDTLPNIKKFRDKNWPP